MYELWGVEEAGRNARVDARAIDCGGAGVRSGVGVTGNYAFGGQLGIKDIQSVGLTTASEVPWVRALGAGACYESGGDKSEERREHYDG